MSHTKNDYPDNVAWCLECSSPLGTVKYYGWRHVDTMLSERDERIIIMADTLKWIAKNATADADVLHVVRARARNALAEINHDRPI